jgi:hypothetical protein
MSDIVGIATGAFVTITVQLPGVDIKFYERESKLLDLPVRLCELNHVTTMVKRMKINEMLYWFC